MDTRRPDPLASPRRARLALSTFTPMAAEPYVVVPEFRTASEEQAVALFARLQALAEELGVELVTAPWVPAVAYDAPESAND